MLYCARLPHARALCCCGCRDALRMDSPAAYSHRADKVSVSVPLLPTGVEGAQESPLSRATVLVCCAVRMRAQQRLCPGCSHWKAVGKFARQETCSDCRSPAQQCEAEEVSTPATPCPATSTLGTIVAH